MSKPPVFPDVSIGGDSRQNDNLFDEISSGRNVDSALKSAAAAGAKLVPEVGALLSALVSVLWPDPDKNKSLVWKDIESKVEVAASGLINHNNSKQIRNVTEGLYNVTRLPLD